MIEAIFVSEGNTVDFVPTADVSAGEVIVVGELRGVVNRDAAAGELVGLHVRGVYEIVKGSAATANVGDIAYWDESADDLVFASGSGNTEIGVVIQEVLATDTHALVMLRP